jgi:hypothetical protein
MQKITTNLDIIFNSNKDLMSNIKQSNEQIQSLRLKFINFSENSLQNSQNNSDLNAAISVNNSENFEILQEKNEKIELLQFSMHFEENEFYTNYLYTEHVATDRESFKLEGDIAYQGLNMLSQSFDLVQLKSYNEYENDED